MDQNGKDDLKTQFATREGTYRLMTLSEYSRPNRVGYQSNQNNPQVRVSLITLPSTVTAQTVTVAPLATAGTSQHPPPPQSSTSTGISTISTVIANGQDPLLLQPLQQQQQQQQQTTQLQQQQQLQQGAAASDRICFNFGKELYVYAYRGVKKVRTHFSSKTYTYTHSHTNLWLI